MTITLPPNVPATEVNETFLQGMVNRMAVSFCKYGAIADAYPKRVDAIESLMVRLRKYEQTSNTEYLMDVANFAMIEFTHPKHLDAHFKAEDSHASPGRKWHGEVDPNQDTNRPRKLD